MYKDELSSYVYFDKLDIEPLTIIHIFKSVNFEYNQMSGKPIKFDYNELKDSIKWSGLECKKYVPVLKAMCKSFISHLAD